MAHRSHLIARRVAAAGALVAVVAAGLAVHLWLPDTAVTDIAGDALYAVAALSFVVVLAPRLSAVVAGAIAAVWCVGIELFQLTGIPLAAGQAFPPAMLVLGTVFDPRDLVVYVVAVAVAVGVDAGETAVVERGSGSRSGGREGVGSGGRKGRGPGGRGGVL